MSDRRFRNAGRDPGSVERMVRGRARVQGDRSGCRDLYPWTARVLDSRERTIQLVSGRLNIEHTAKVGANFVRNLLHRFRKSAMIEIKYIIRQSRAVKLSARAGGD